MATEIWVSIGSGNGLLPDGTKPLPEEMLTYHKYGPVTLIWGQFHKRYLSHWPLKSVRILLILNLLFESLKGKWVKGLELYKQIEDIDWEEPYLSTIFGPSSVNWHTFHHICITFWCQIFFHNHDKSPLKDQQKYHVLIVNDLIWL